MVTVHETSCELVRPAVRDWREVIDAEFPSFGDVTEETKRVTADNSQRFRGSVRLSTQRFYTTAEYEAMRQEELAKPLP